jgi:hypothetical protein
MWNGTAEILNDMPAITKTRPKIDADRAVVLERRGDAGELRPCR